jgi:hypothetical protein
LNWPRPAFASFACVSIHSLSPQLYLIKFRLRPVEKIYVELAWVPTSNHSANLSAKILAHETRYHTLYKHVFLLPYFPSFITSTLTVYPTFEPNITPSSMVRWGTTVIVWYVWVELYEKLLKGVMEVSSENPLLQGYEERFGYLRDVS